MIAPPSLPKPSIGSLRPSSSVTPPLPNASAPGVCEPFHQQLHSSLLSSGWRLGGTAWEGALATSVTSRT